MWGNLGRVLTEQQATSMDMIRREFTHTLPKDRLNGSRTHGCGCPRVSHPMGAGAEFHPWVYTRPVLNGCGCGYTF
jgi:hypothetical protein